MKHQPRQSTIDKCLARLTEWNEDSLFIQKTIGNTVHHWRGGESWCPIVWISPTSFLFKDIVIEIGFGVTCYDSHKLCDIYIRGRLIARIELAKYKTLMAAIEDWIGQQ